MKRILMLGLSVLLLSACAADLSSLGYEQATPTPASTPTPLPTPVTVFQTTISADGELVLPFPAQRFSFQTPGLASTIEEIYVVPGQAVKQGDLLARIDDTDLRNALARAEAKVTLLEAETKNNEAPALAGDIAEAQASLASAQAELDRLLSLPSEEAITQAAADLRLREIDLRRAQEAYDVVAYAQGIGLSPQAAELERATLNYERAQAIYDEATQPATEAQLAAAHLNVLQAQNGLEKLQDGLRPEARAVNQARLTEAQLEVDEARANLIKARLYAPWDGVVTAVEAAPGISTANAAITIAQVEPLRFATSNFSERNLADVKTGDSATIFLTTYPGVPIPAVIYRIELESERRDGPTALFTVYFDLNSGDLDVRPGMTGRVEITITPDR
jgi:HlyD family secretion protein